jgi:hypothetical protein
MPVSKIRDRICQQCNKQYTLGVESSQHKYCSLECRGKWHYTRWKSNGGKRDKNKTRGYWLKHIYGITQEEYTSLFEKQNSSCAICLRTEPPGYGWHIDHCHSTKKIRGILCQYCNQALGMFEDKKETLERAIKYLNEN